jgi:hypothetical protein
LLLRFEAFALLTAAVIGYCELDASWLQFAIWLLVPDIALLAYLVGPRFGAAAYNAVHSYVAPSLLAVLAYGAGWPRLWPFCVIWLAHIGMDRTLGLGLKFASAFRDTHLGTVGRVAPTV